MAKFYIVGLNKGPYQPFAINYLISINRQDEKLFSPTYGLDSDEGRNKAYMFSSLEDLLNAINDLIPDSRLKNISIWQGEESFKDKDIWVATTQVYPNSINSRVIIDNEGNCEFSDLNEVFKAIKDIKDTKNIYNIYLNKKTVNSISYKWTKLGMLGEGSPKIKEN